MRRCSSDIVGWVSYVLEDFIVPDIGFVNYNNERPEQLWNKFCNIDFIHPIEPGGAKVLCEWIQDWKQKFEASVLEMCVCCFGVTVVLNICVRASPMFMVPIRAQRGPRRSDLIGGKPAKSAIHRFRVHLKCARASVDDRPPTASSPDDIKFRRVARTHSFQMGEGNSLHKDSAENGEGETRVCGNHGFR